MPIIILIIILIIAFIIVLFTIFIEKVFYNFYDTFVCKKLVEYIKEENNLDSLILLKSKISEINTFNFKPDFLNPKYIKDFIILLLEKRIKELK